MCQESQQGLFSFGVFFFQIIGQAWKGKYLPVNMLQKNRYAIKITAYYWGKAEMQICSGNAVCSSYSEIHPYYQHRNLTLYLYCLNGRNIFSAVEGSYWTMFLYIGNLRIHCDRPKKCFSLLINEKIPQIQIINRVFSMIRISRGTFEKYILIYWDN